MNVYGNKAINEVMESDDRESTRKEFYDLETNCRDARYIFIGNREYVLDQMFELGLNIVKIYVVKDSFLEERLNGSANHYAIVSSREELVKEIEKISADYVISNGCPYILPISWMDKRKKYINIHPSLLPDLKGKNPINGALLYGRRHGVTCHYMVDQVDAGEIISQIEIPITESTNLDLLYQLSFRMEGEVFKEAFFNEFRAKQQEMKADGTIYYSRKVEDGYLTKADSLDIILRKVKAFSTEGQYAGFFCNGQKYEVVDAKIIENNAVDRLFGRTEENKVIMQYGGKFLLVKKDGRFLQLQLKDALLLNTN